MLEVGDLLRSRGHSVIPFAMKHPSNEQTGFEEYFVSSVDYYSSDPVEKLRGGLRMLYSVEAARKIRSLARKERPQVGHMHNIAHQLSPSILGALKDEGVRTVMTAHDYKLICPNYRLYTEDEICNRCKGGKFYNAYQHNCMMDSAIPSAMVTIEMYFHRFLEFYDRHLDVVIAPSEFMEKKLVEFGMDPDRVHLLRHFALMDEPASDHDDGFILYAGRLEKEKGVDLLLSAMKGSELPLKIAGDGSKRRELELQSEDLGEGRVEFLGAVPGEMMAKLLRSCSFVVIPSRWYENAPMVVYESFAAGKPVIGARVGGIPELVINEVNGLTFENESVEELSNCLELLSSDSDKRRQMGMAARSFAEEMLSPQAHVKELERIYAGTVS
jgi:glycosyltransferase involved in cell wall biosynthesis